MKSLTGNVMIIIQVVSTLVASLLMELLSLLQFLSKFISLTLLADISQYNCESMGTIFAKVDLFENTNSQPKILIGNWEK